MSTLKDLLPPPTDDEFISEDNHSEKNATVTIAAVSSSSGANVSNVISLKCASDSEPDYSAVVRLGENANRTVHTHYDAMVQKPRMHTLKLLPSQTEVENTTLRTKATLENVVSGKMIAGTSNRPKKKPGFIRYTPANVSSGTQQRIIKMVQAPRDPMEPPRFTQRKAPVNPPSPPVPVMHSPERKLSKMEAAEWKIPPVVSDWKNNRGYAISLDKRLAADGRALVDRSVNDRFAQMAEALYQAEKTARQEVEKRASLQRQVSLRAKAARERELRELAEKARQERKEFLGLDQQDAGDAINAKNVTTGLESSTQGIEVCVEDEAPPILKPSDCGLSQNEAPRRRRSRFGNREESDSYKSIRNSLEGGVRYRTEIRRERRIQRNKEMALREIHGDESGKPTLKRSKITRDLDRDLSERAALGQSIAGPTNGEILYDERLFNQDGNSIRARGRSTVAGGFGADDSYNIYEEPLFRGSSLSNRNLHFRGNHADKANEVDGKGDDERERTGGNGLLGYGRGREGPVEFEHDDERRRTNFAKPDEDPYGLNRFLSDADHNRARKT